MSRLMDLFSWLEKRANDVKQLGYYRRVWRRQAIRLGPKGRARQPRGFWIGRTPEARRLASGLECNGGSLCKKSWGPRGDKSSNADEC